MMRVYVITSERGLVKVGVSKSLDRRLRDLEAEGYGNCTLHFMTPPRSDCGQVEAFAHDLLAAWRTDGEWFRTEPEKAVDAVKRAVVLVEAGERSARRGNAERQAEMRRREAAAGLKRVMVTIPAERAAELAEMVEIWRREAAKAGRI